MSLAKALTLPIVLTFSVAAASSPKRAIVNVTGTYSSNWNDVSLVQEGTSVRGTYVCCGGGTIDGRVIEGSIIRYTWRQPGGHGEGVWRVTKSRRLDGTWGLRQSDNDGGPWTLVPKRSSDPNGGQIAQ
jgi:hypothetical protein